METRSGEFVSAQIGTMGVIPKGSIFRLGDGMVFNIKNDGIKPVVLQVQLAAMKDDEFIETSFEIGWNPEIVKAVKVGTSQELNLKFGY